MPVADKAHDLIAYDNTGRVILVAEVKRRLGTSEDWAAHFRRNILGHGALPAATFFLITTPERMYFWKQDHHADSGEPPSFTLDAAKALKPYLQGLGKETQDLGEHALKLLISSWLTELAGTRNSSGPQDPSTRWLNESGLLDSLKAARIELNPA